MLNIRGGNVFLQISMHLIIMSLILNSLFVIISGIDLLLILGSNFNEILNPIVVRNTKSMATPYKSEVYNSALHGRLGTKKIFE